MNRFESNRRALRVFALLMALLALQSLVSCGTKAGNGATSSTLGATVDTSAATTAETEPAAPELVCTVTTVGFDGPVSTYTATQKTYLSDAAKNATNYAEGKLELSRPLPITLRWNVDFEDGENSLRYFVVRIWTKSDKSDAREFIVGRSAREFQFQNACVGQKYYWDVAAIGADGIPVRSTAGTFATEDRSVRFLCVDGVTNVRDLGGKKTEDGGRIRQGLIFRGAELHKEGTTVLVSDEGIEALRLLGIKSELDFRTESEAGTRATSVIGDGVKYYFRTLSGSKDFTSSACRSSLKTIFKVLADESNYPIYLHCMVGTDRTGLICWLVNGLCGASEDDLWRDYLLSNFASIGDPRKPSKIQNNYVDKLAAASGATYAEKVYNYLKNTVGIPASDLDAVIRIMKAAPGTTAENRTGAIPAGHTHTPGNEYAVVEKQTCSSPGILVRYCTVCGSFVPKTLTVTPVSEKSHNVKNWTVTTDPTLTSDGQRRGACADCGRTVEETFGVPVYDSKNLSGLYADGGSIVVSKTVSEIRGNKHFYPTASDSDGNDLWFEYSFLWNNSFQNYDTFGSEMKAFTFRTANDVHKDFYYLYANDKEGRDCPFAGHFDYSTYLPGCSPAWSCAVDPGNGQPVYKAGWDSPVTRNSSPYVYDAVSQTKGGWRRLGFRFHQEAAIKNGAVEYAGYSELYIDGVKVWKVKTNMQGDAEKSLKENGLLLFTAEIRDGKLVYTDNDAMRVQMRVDNVAKSTKAVYVAVYDPIWTCGDGFVRNVSPVVNPAAGKSVTLPNGSATSGAVFYSPD